VRTRGADLGERDHVLWIVDGDADHVGARGLEQLDLADRGRDVHGARRGHGLHGDGVRPADLHIADPDLTRLSVRHVAYQTIGSAEDSSFQGAGDRARGAGGMLSSRA
jgi:hypothetical protein